MPAVWSPLMGFLPILDFGHMNLAHSLLRCFIGRKNLLVFSVAQNSRYLPLISFASSLRNSATQTTTTNMEPSPELPSDTQPVNTELDSSVLVDTFEKLAVIDIRDDGAVIGGEQDKLNPDAETVETAPYAKTAIYYHPTCSLHRIPDHPEQHRRVDGILSTLRTTWPADLKFRESKPVTKDQILLFHTPALLSRFQKLAENALLTYQKKKTVAYLPIDMDTTVMWQTRAAAFHAAGAVISALDHMYAPATDANKIDTAFCCVRPPGHHAERDKAGGFCFFNNVAIGARYAQQTHGVSKVAILDPDVHHGNGTEEGFTDDPSVFYGSTHGRDHYPGTGHDPSPHVGALAKKEVDRRIVNRLLTPGPKSRPEFRTKWREILDEMERFQPELVMMSTGFDAHDDDPLASCELEDEDYYWFTAEVVASCARITAARNNTAAAANTDSTAGTGTDKSIGTDADADTSTNSASTGNDASTSTPVRPVRYMSVLEGGYDLPAIQRSAVCHVRALLEGYPQIDGTSRGTTAHSAAAKVDGVEPAERVEGGEEAAAGKGRPPVDGEIAALREYLEAFGVKDL